MHSIPPLVTISSSSSGRRPWSRSWRSTRYSRRLGMPSHGAYWSATPASSRTSCATISSSSSDGKVAGLGKPPASESTPSGLPARIVVSSAAAWFCARRAKVTMPWHDTAIRPDGLTRRDALALLGGRGRRRVAARPRRARRPAWADGEYWAFADRCQRLLDDLWSPAAALPERRARRDEHEREPAVHPRRGGARRPHGRRAAGRARAGDRRAAVRGAAVAAGGDRARRRPADRRDQTHDWGWGATMDSHEHQHVAIDAAVVRGLAQAWLARGPLGLDAAPADAIATAVQRCADSPFYAYPALRLNQINWPIEIFAWAAAVDRRHAAAAPRDPAAARPLRRRADARGPAVPDPVHRPGLPVPLRAAATAPTPAPTSTAPSTRRRSAARCSSTSRRCGPGMDPLLPRQRAALLRLGRARAVRLLDARRLPELGHRRELPPLAPGRRSSASPRRRCWRSPSRRRCSRRPSTAAGPSTCSTAGSRCSTAGRAAATSCRRRCCSA